MNTPIVDPLQGDFPEIIEEYLEHGVMKCISFNRRGTLLAAGCADGSFVVWDFETRGIAKEFRDKECNSAITSICWSKYGQRILVSAADKSLSLWDVVKGEKVAFTRLQQMPLKASLDPVSSSFQCLVCPLSSVPMVVDLADGSIKAIPASVSGLVSESVPLSNGKPADSIPSHIPLAASFNKNGDLIYVGNLKGEVLIIEKRSLEVHAVIDVSGSSAIKNIVFSRNGKYILINSNDRIIRIYENLLPSKGAVQVLEGLNSEANGLDRVEILKAAGFKSVALFGEFQDSITRIHWKSPCFSGDGEWVVAGSANKGEHKIYIWDRAGHLVKMLEGPKEALLDLAWHPVHPIVASVSLVGLVYIWAKDYTENWSAFAPDFKELEENEEYIEREDEFDTMPEIEKVKEIKIDEDIEVDIMTMDKDSTFSDSDASQEELCFLPAMPSPDVVEPQEHGVVSISKMEESNISGSPFSENGEQNGHVTNNPGSPAEDESGSRLRRKRKPSEKVLEMQAEKGGKPPKAKSPFDKSS
uniref:Uncharacterized protein n=1 Tax=Kalanchoe fedtschenkoi TaxID=63787 RepID=A0A7N0ZYC1_KALFE